MLCRVQVLTKALQVWGLTAIPVDSQELQQSGFEAQAEKAFLCNLQVWGLAGRVGVVLGATRGHAS